MHNWRVCRFKGRGAWRKRASGVFEEGLIPQCTLGMIHIWCPWKLSNFQDPPPTLSIYVQDSSTLLTSDIQFQITRPPLQMITNQLKENVIQGWLIYVIKSFLQVGFHFQYQLINLVWLSFDFFSFSWSLTICFFVALYSCLCSCPKT